MEIIKAKNYATYIQFYTNSQGNKEIITKKQADRYKKKPSDNKGRVTKERSQEMLKLFI